MLRTVRPDHLLARARAGDERALDALLRRHRPDVVRICRSVTHCPQDAEDATQVALLAVAKRLPDLTDPELDLPAYLAVVARRAALATVRGRERGRHLEDRVRAGADREPGEGADRAAERADTQARVRRAVAALPERQREAVVLHHLLGVPFASLAERTGLSANALCQLTHRGRRGLRAQLA